MIVALIAISGVFMAALVALLVYLAVAITKTARRGSRPPKAEPETHRFMVQFGASLEFYRRQAGLTQAPAAKAVGVKTRLVKAWEKGELTPSALQLSALAETYGTTLEQIFTKARG